ncbi:interferon alpha-4-like [Brachyhypopomus gauderio]|uniref:interferon alpha-4-like n=1 Tax=Brachyhypopomus gauderio TaxID=698409 RepID=UPI004042ACD7
MDGLKVLSVVLAVFSLVDAAVVPCKWTQFRLEYLNEKSVELLLNMSAPIPLKCLEEKVKMEAGFPDDVFQEAQNLDVALVALETLRGVGRIFQNDHTSVTWDQETLKTFKHIVSSRQVENLKKCVGQDAPQDAAGSLAKLGSFYDRLEEQLRLKEFSECAWEIAREEVKVVLMKFHEFLKSRS